MYGRRARLPLPLAEAFLTTLSNVPCPLFPATGRPADLPVCVDGSAAVADGKKIKRVVGGLLPTCRQPGQL